MRQGTRIFAIFALLAVIVGINAFSWQTDRQIRAASGTTLIPVNYLPLVRLDPTSTRTPTLTPTCTPNPPVFPTSTPGRICCKVCTTGKACGDTCINRNYTCHQPPGCACDG
jgi:hypothetical protein